MMIKTLTAVGLAFGISGTAHCLSKADKKLIDEYLKLPSTIQLIEADESLMSLSPEELYKKIEDEGILRDIKYRQKVEKWIKNQPEYSKYVESQELNPFELLPEYRYLDLNNPKVIHGLPWDGDPFDDQYNNGLFQNQLNPSYPGTATCIAKVRGNVSWFKAGPHILAPWDKVMPLIDCVDFAKKRKIDPQKCYIAACTPTTAMPSSLQVSHLIRDILLGLWN